MPLDLSEFDDSPLCHGNTWEIRDRETLVTYVAQVILGQYMHVSEILASRPPLRLPLPRSAFIRSEVEKLRNPGSEPLRWQRDGWIFQMISWIAAQVARAGRTPAVFRAPHPQRADKGPDGLIVELKDPVRVVLCEDKATENPRTTITGKVWPEFRAFEEGQRDGELNSEVSTLMSQLQDSEEIARAIEDARWRDELQYRIAITIEDQHHGTDGRRNLFSGYDECVKGSEATRRIAETIVLEDLRHWMDEFCAEVADKIITIEAELNV
jgi:hypothetical protein